MALIAAIPKEVWIGVAVLAAIGIAVYLYGKSKGSQSNLLDQQPSAAQPRPSQPSVPATRRVSAQSVARFTDTDTPVSTGAVQAEASSFRIPSAPKGFGNASWVPPGQPVSVAGVTIPNGMVYVGTKLPTPSGSNDPCLIDPSKSVARQGDYTERQMGYWPSYSEISGGARKAYLNWLAGGRQDPEADIGYVFLFFYGLERRAIIDAAKDEAARADWPAIAAELRRLLAIYGSKSGSFRGYAGSLLDWVALAEHPARLYEKPVPSFPKTYELPLYVRLALGQAAVDAAPVPAHLALAWARLEPNIYLRTPATRCAAEFEQLFAVKYAEAFGAGMVMPRNRTKLKLVYRPASEGFRGYEELKLTFRDTPDVTVLTASTKKLQEVVEAATKPLESFSRAVGKNPDAKASLEALLQLPAPLWPGSAQKALQALKARMGEGMVAMSFQDLLNALGANSAFTKDKTLSLARALESANVGFEPDVLGGAKLSTKTDARQALGVRTIVDDASLYDQLKLMARFVRLAGFSGLLVSLDELVNLYKLANTQARNSNYEQILRILNDSLQGTAVGLGFVLGGTPEFLLDTRRGLYSYPALQSRLAQNTFATNGLVDFSGPVVRLSSLTPEDFYVLLQKIRSVYGLATLPSTCFQTKW